MPDLLSLTQKLGGLCVSARHFSYPYDCAVPLRFGLLPGKRPPHHPPPQEGFQNRSAEPPLVHPPTAFQHKRPVLDARNLVRKKEPMEEETPIIQTYAALLASIKERIQGAQVRAALAVNRELILLYWGIGKEILARQQEEGWGTKVIERLAKDLRSAFPEMRGFSRTNLLYMRAFSEAWPEESIVQHVAGQLPWFHNCIILDKIKDRAERLWYIQAAIENGWSRNVLVIQIEGGLHARQGKALTNFHRTLPAPQSDLAQQLLKDPYNRCRRCPGERNRDRLGRAHPEVPRRAGHWLCVCRPPVSD